MGLDEISESPILSLITRIFDMRQRGESVIGLHVGEPDFPTPPGICEAAYRSMREGHTHYVSAQGLPELRAAVARTLAQRYQIPADADDVVILPAKFAVYASFLATLGPGAEVLLPDPTYLFEQPIQLIGGRPVYVPLNPDFSLDIHALERARTDRTRAVVLVTPSNPTGRVLTSEEVHGAVRFAEDHSLVLLSDETYAPLIYEGSHIAPASVARRGASVVTIGSFSKAYSMTGWRVGYAVAPPEIRSRLVKIVEHTLTCVPPFIQDASVWALENAGADEERFREEFRRRRDHLLARLREIPGITCHRPQGAFYMFPRYDAPIGSIPLCERLLDEESLALVPGRAFGPHGEWHVRISYSSPEAVLDEGVERFARFLRRNRPD